jgi:hypothetical protein
MRENQHSSGSEPSSDDTATKVDCARFSQKELRELSFELSARWFSREPTPRLTLSVVHPWRIHAYWHVPQAVMKSALATAKRPHALVIRFTDLTPGQTGNASEEATFDIEVDGLDNNWYIDVWQAGRRYSAELGLRDADDDLYVLLRSNDIQLPRAEPSSTLEFSLAQYRGIKPIPEPKNAADSALSVAHLADLLPPFEGLPERPPAEVKQVPGEPAFSSANLARVQGWDPGPTTGSGATSLRERTRYGTEFPEVPVDTASEAPADLANSDLPFDYATVPALPDVDPQTVSGSSMRFSPAPLAGILAAKASSAENTEGSVSENSSGPASLNRRFPEVRAPVAHLDDHQVGSQLPQSTLDDPVLYAGATGTSASAASEDRWSTDHLAPTSPAARPVVPLEEAIAETYFSATNYDMALDFSAELELSGISSADESLTLFGEPVKVDGHGRFSIRIKLNKGPNLAAFLRAQRQTISEQH